MKIEVKCYPGYVYKLDANTISVYGSCGIALRLSERILAQLASDVINTRIKSRYLDQKGRQFTMSIEGEQMVFDIKGGELVHVDGELLYPPVAEKVPRLRLVA